MSKRPTERTSETTTALSARGSQRISGPQILAEGKFECRRPDRSFCLAFLALFLAGCSAAPAPRLHATMQCMDSAQLNGQRIVPAGRVDRGEVAFRLEEHVGGRGDVAGFSIDTHEAT